MKIPSATYRLQFTPEFGFAEAGEVLPYLHDLGISDIYASPIFHARAGSRHGYDVVDPNRLNPELGSDEAFASLIEQSRRQGLGWVQDIVPNHMAYDGQNRMLMDVLENGEASPFLRFLRYRLAASLRKHARKSTGAVSRRLLWRMPGEGRDHAALRPARARRSLFFFAAAGQSRILQRGVDP